DRLAGGGAARRANHADSPAIRRPVGGPPRPRAVPGRRGAAHVQYRGAEGHAVGGGAGEYRRRAAHGGGAKSDAGAAGGAATVRSGSGSSVPRQHGRGRGICPLGFGVEWRIASPQGGQAMAARKTNKSTTPPYNHAENERRINAEMEAFQQQKEKLLKK